MQNETDKKTYLHLLLLIVAAFFVSCATNRIPATQYYLDNDGTSISKKEFQLKWRDNSRKYAGVKYIAKDSGMVFKLSHPVYETYQIAYQPFHQMMEEVMESNFSDSTIFILDYTFKDDYCTDAPPNEWNKQRLNNRFRYLQEQIDLTKKEYANILYSKHFERGIKLPEFSEKQKEIFFLDNSGFLRDKVFRNPSLCGSFAIIKPNGEMLIRNGEYGVQGIVQHLKTENWKLFFTKNSTN